MSGLVGVSALHVLIVIADAIAVASYVASAELNPFKPYFASH